MPNGTLDLMKLDGQPVTYQIMFEQNAGGTFVARVESDELVPFLHEEMRVDMPTAESAAQRLDKESRVRLPNIFLEENNLHAVMDYMEEELYKFCRFAPNRFENSGRSSRLFQPLIKRAPPTSASSGGQGPQARSRSRVSPSRDSFRLASSSIAFF